jgi:hypothetical protein
VPGPHRVPPLHRIETVLFSGHAPRGHAQQPGGEDERPIGTRQRVAERLNRAPVRVGGVLEPAGEGDVVLEREMDHTVRLGGGAAQHVEVVQTATAHLDAGRDERGGRGIGAREPDDLVTKTRMVHLRDVSRCH